MRFIDLFAGLGGFHVALSDLGYRCVFACERDERLRKLYTENFNISCLGDIKQIKEEDIPDHDILCAGFPCQPFSKAGKQKGLTDVGRGDLIHDIFRIIRYHKPRYFILENVPNIKKHDRESTWKFLEETLREIGYDVKEAILSPHEFGVPQIRERIFIVGIYEPNGLSDFKFPETKIFPNLDIRQVLDKEPPDAKKLSLKQLECIKIWQDIIDVVPSYVPLPAFPIWGMEFGATYPYNKVAPYRMASNELSSYNGMFGRKLMGLSKDEQLLCLPSYAKYDENQFPRWKQNYIKRNREFLNTYKKEFQPLFKKLKAYAPSWQKLEWNCGNADRVILKHLIQFRASGIRIKRSTYSPTLVLTSTQIPIIGWEKRYITLREAARLQGLDVIKLPDISASRALGNAVNATIVKLVAQKLIQAGNKDIKEKISIARLRADNLRHNSTTLQESIPGL